jgi:hypothetical protein
MARARLEWNFDGFPDLEKLEVGTPFSHNVRQHLSGPRSGKAAIRISQWTGDNPQDFGWKVSGDFLEWNGDRIGTGTFKLEAIT